MLIKLLPEQVARNWEAVRYSIEQSTESLPGENVDRFANVLEEVFLNKMHVWLSVNERKVVEGVVTTRLQKDQVSGTRTLFIYSVYGYVDVSYKSWAEGFKSLCKFAEAERCSYISAMTANDSLVRLAERLGGRADYRHIVIGLNSGN